MERVYSMLSFPYRTPLETSGGADAQMSIRLPSMRIAGPYR